MKNAIEISVVIPARDEAGRVGDTLVRVGGYLSGMGAGHEIIVVDDGSMDGTAEAALGSGVPGVRVLSNGVNLGKGRSVQRGFLDARGECVLFTDADLSTPIEELGRFMREVKRGADMVIGSRALPGSRILLRQPYYRTVMGRCFNRCVRRMTKLPYADTQCGFKLFRRDRCDAVFRAMRTARFAFDVELLLLARNRGLVVRELPVVWINSPYSKVHPVKDSLRMLLDLSRMRKDKLA